MSKETFSLKTIQNLLDMIQNRDYVIEQLEFKNEELDGALSCEAMKWDFFLNEIDGIISNLEYSINEELDTISHYISLRHAVNQSIEKLKKVKGDYE